MQTAKGNNNINGNNNKVKRRRAPRTTNTQYALMLDYCARNNVLISGRQSQNGNEDIDKLWTKLAALLNNCGSGSSKSVDQWKRTWVEWKCNTKRRFRELNDDAKVGGRGLSPLENQLMHLIGTIDNNNSNNQTDLLKEDLDKDPSPLDSLEMVLENSSSEESNSIEDAANTANLPPPHFFQYAESTATTAGIHRHRLQQQNGENPENNEQHESLPIAFSMINNSLNNVAVAIRELAASQFKMAESNFKLAEVILQQINLNAAAAAANKKQL